MDCGFSDDHTVSRLNTRKEDELQPETLEALSAVRVNGKLAPVYLQFANSEPAIRAYLLMEDSLRQGSLTDREIEAVKLLISQRTGCDFCLSIHTYKSDLAGLSADEQLRLRSGKSIGDQRIDTLIVLTLKLLHCAQALDENVLQMARDAGLTDENLVDLTMLMSTILFTNFTNHINHSRSTLPPAPPLPAIAHDGMAGDENS